MACLTNQPTCHAASPRYRSTAGRKSQVCTDSPLEGTGFKPWVPRDTTKFSTPAHVTCLTPCTRKSRREREPILRGCRPPPAEPMVRILFPPAESPLRTRLSCPEIAKKGDLAHAPQARPTPACGRGRGPVAGEPAVALSRA